MSNLVKVGILLDEYNELRNWELRLIQEIVNAQDLELSLLIEDGRLIAITSPEDTKKHVLAENILRLQFKFEEKLFGHKSTINKEELFSSLSGVEVIKLKPEGRNCYDYFSNSDSKLVKKCGLDVILKFTFAKISGEILDLAKYGVWTFDHLDKQFDSPVDLGFWENVHKESSIPVAIKRVGLKNDKVIDITNFNRHFSSVKTNKLVNEAAVSLLLKNIRRLKADDVKLNYLSVDLNAHKGYPGTLMALKYCSQVYNFLFSRFVERLSYRLFSTRSNCWTLFVGKGNILEYDISKLNPMVLPKDEFWADPFLFPYKGELYVFFENYSYKANRAKISCGKIEGNQLIDIKDVLDLDYHLSYPYIIEEDGEIYLMPESNKQEKISIYKCRKFPDEWELYSTAFEGELVADAFFYNDEQKQKWLFVNKRNPNTTFANELFIYKVDSLKMEKLIPHKNNPVIIDARTARNGGAIFRYNNDIYRPSQSNIMGIYGRNININKITKLSIEEYEEETIRIVKPDFHKNLVATHHLHQIKDYFVIDAAYKMK
ncbi:hypothetical protein E9993_08970 [Labilibacter sediminis]|nr:hypothetical protein E9993_08970 [Labilibacter sediminis]